MYILKKINKCLYTGEKYHILYSTEDNVDKKFLYKNREVDSLFDEDKFLEKKGIRAFCNIHKNSSVSKTIDDKDYEISGIIYHPSSVYVRKDLRGKGFGVELYKKILSSIKVIHKKEKLPPLFVQHEIAESWASTCKLSKKIYKKLLSESILQKYSLGKDRFDFIHDTEYENMLSMIKDGWYNIDMSKVEDGCVKMLKKRDLL